MDDSTTARSEEMTETTASGLSSLTDLTAFNASLEMTLTWLAEATERLHKMKPLSDEVETVKEQFHEHEV